MTIVRSLSFFLFTLSFSALFATSYRFTGAVSTRFNDPANWLPSYPGERLDAGDEWIISAPAHFSGSVLAVEGGLRIEAKGALVAPEASLMLGANAWLDHRGQLQVRSLVAKGTLLAMPWSRMETRFCRLEAGSEVMMQAESELSIATDLLLAGRMDLHGRLAIAGEFTQTGHLTAHRQAGLQLGGNYWLEGSATLWHHPETSQRFLAGAFR